MKTHARTGGFIKALTILVVGLGVIFIVFVVLAKYIGPQTFNTIGRVSTISTNSTVGNIPTETKVNPLLDFGTDGGYVNTNRGIPNTDGIGISPHSGKVFLTSGSASWTAQPADEYVMIKNSGEPVTITGWVLTNGKGSRPIENTGNSYFYPTADSAVIGEGTEFLDPSGVFTVGPIILARGDNAIVTTGGPFGAFPFSIYTSFRENICDGYLKYYPFEPALTRNCPYPSEDALIRTVTDECYAYMSSLGRCKDPERDDKTNFDEQTSLCKNFMRARLTYPMCVQNNKHKAGFSLSQWRVFLGKKSQLWASQRETITLYDSKGLIVDQVSY